MAYSNMEPLNNYLTAIDKPINTHESDDGETDNREKLKSIIKKVMNSDSAFDEFFKSIFELQNEVSRLSKELEMARSEKKLVKEKLKMKKSKLEALRLGRCEAHIKILFLLRNEVIAVLDSYDPLLENQIESVFRKWIDVAKSEAYKYLPDEVEAMIQNADRIDRAEAPARAVDADVAEESGLELMLCDVIGGLKGALVEVCCTGRNSDQDD